MFNWKLSLKILVISGGLLLWGVIGGHGLVYLTDWLGVYKGLILGVVGVVIIYAIVMGFIIKKPTP